MKAIILCAGYATRLYPLTKDKPKHLLTIAGKPMLEYTIAKIEQVSEIDSVYIITNHRFYHLFQKWLSNLKTEKKIELIDDGTSSDEIKLGAIGDMKFVIDKLRVNDDLLVLAGDNLFQLNLNDFVKFFKTKGTSIAVYDVKSKDLVQKYSEIRLDNKNRVVSFVEKPAKPETTLAAICMYLFPKEKLDLVNKYLAEGNSPDQPGRYIQWLHKKELVYGFVFCDNWYDIGDINQYKQANKEYEEQNSKS
ncbi:MAG: nucleotidyltransferase family protein [Elusimicrobia bacterium]|nr:nucleotidyltransferase family protein [Elusimicrobiota bacterium]